MFVEAQIASVAADVIGGVPVAPEELAADSVFRSILLKLNTPIDLAGLN